MNILLDECLPRRLKFHITGHNVQTVPEMGWAGTKNGALLRLAEAQFDIFITADQNLQYQQNLKSNILGIVVLVSPNNRLETLAPFVPQLLGKLATIQAGEVIHITR
jgi:hypothetical protein